MMNRLLLAGACAGAILAAPALAPEASAKTLRWSFQGDIATLDPYAHTESFTANVLHHIYDPLVRRDKDLAIEPALAESWQIIEPTRWRFKLRQGVKFHNGNAFDADDVVASITRLLDPAARARGNLATVVRAEKGVEEDLLLEGGAFNGTLGGPGTRRAMERFLELGGQTRDGELRLGDLAGDL
jgi:peptide/nickel transport system substrate-binding protein